MSDLDEYPVQCVVPVAWGDMDAFAHVNNAKYFVYFESARIAYFEKMGSWPGGAPDGIGPILAETSCRFKAPVTFPDTLTVGARVIDVGEDRFEMEFAAVSEKLGRIAAIGKGTIVSFDYTHGTKATLPSAWRQTIAELEGWPSS